DEALAAGEQAYRMAAKLGNDTLSTAVIGNLVMYCSRLGRYDDQSRWVAQVPKHRSSEFAGLVDVQIAYTTGLGAALRGQRSQADETIDSLEKRIPRGAPPWILQVWHLYRADVLWIMGRHSEAIRTATAEIKASNCKVLSKAH